MGIFNNRKREEQLENIILKLEKENNNLKNQVKKKEKAEWLDKELLSIAKRYNFEPLEIEQNTDEILNACKEIVDEALVLKKEEIKRLEEELQNIDRVKELKDYINERLKTNIKLGSQAVKIMQYRTTMDCVLEKLDNIKPSYKYEELWKGLYRYNDNYKDNNQLKKSMAKLIVKCMDALEKEWIERQNLQRSK